MTTTFTDTWKARQEKELVEAGFDRQFIDVRRGDEDLGRLDPAGAEHGVLERLRMPNS